MPTATTSRKRVPAAQRRTLLLDAADQVFADRGYRAAGVDVIARHAGVSVPVLYDHFRSKTDLYAELLARHYQALREVWFRHAATGEPLDHWLGLAVAEWVVEVDPH